MDAPEIEKLKALALAASPGPWQWWTSNSTLRLTGLDGKDGGVLHAYVHSGWADISCGAENRAFIEAFNPATAKALLDERAALIAEVERLRDIVENSERGAEYKPPQDYISEKNWQATPCEIFQGKLTSKGYGIGRTGSAHKEAYVKAYGSVPNGLDLDHLCRNPSCVNPLHLEPVTSRENTRRGNSPPGINSRKTHCIRGHLLSGDNLVPGAKGRICVACRADRILRYIKNSGKNHQDEK